MFEIFKKRGWRGAVGLITSYDILFLDFDLGGWSCTACPPD
jgi:hypothetical protein